MRVFALPVAAHRTLASNILWWLLEPLRRFGQGWSVAADRRRALICRLLDAAELPEADWQQTRTGSLVAIGAEKVLKIPLDRVEPDHYAGQNRHIGFELDKGRTVYCRRGREESSSGSYGEARGRVLIASAGATVGKEYPPDLESK